MSTKSKKSDLIILITTFDEKKNAILVSNEILENKLAACISFREITSNYWWNNKINITNEFELLIKTNNANLKKLIKKIVDLHNYAEPEIIYWDVQSNESYSRWLNENCR
tara:strand:- start:530 stop:859 length:330 start_codon:yes stop_codon:yes gene_type:complete